MEYVEKIEITFKQGQILKAEAMNLIVEKVNELVNSANALPEIQAATEGNALEIKAIKDSEIDISQEEFDAMREAGALDVTKRYYTYEDE